MGATQGITELNATGDIPVIYGLITTNTMEQAEDCLLYTYTSLGRPVYGGGGIMPDIFVPQDTTGVTSYLSTAINRGLTIQFTFQYLSLIHI